MKIIRKSLECFYPRINAENFNIQEIEQQVGFKLPPLYKSFNQAFDLSRLPKRELFSYPDGNVIPIGGVDCVSREEDNGFIVGEFFDILGGYDFKTNYYHDGIDGFFPFAHENHYTCLVGIGKENEDIIIVDYEYKTEKVADSIFEFMDKYIVCSILDEFTEDKLKLIHKEWDSEYWTFRDGIESF